MRGVSETVTLSSLFAMWKSGRALVLHPGVKVKNIEFFQRDSPVTISIYFRAR
jgi:hypothetical protein